MKIYLAGPLFTLAEQNFNVRLKRWLESQGYEVWLPQERVEDLKGDSAEAFFARNVDGIDWCDVVLACMDGADPDSGTCWECGYAYSRKTIVAYRTDFRVAQDDGLAPYNLMLTESCWKRIDGPFQNEDELFQRIDTVLQVLPRSRCR